MNFEQRARKARDRNQVVRSAVLLIEGLKRNPQAHSALELLIDIYVNDLDSPGLGYDLASAVALQPNARAIYERLLEHLHAQQKDSMGQELVAAAAEDGIELAWPPPAKAKSPAEPATPAPAVLEHTTAETFAPESGGAESGGAESGGAESGGAESGGAGSISDESASVEHTDLESTGSPNLAANRVVALDDATPETVAPETVAPEPGVAPSPERKAPSSHNSRERHEQSDRPQRAQSSRPPRKQAPKNDNEQKGGRQKFRALLVAAFVLIGLGGYFWWAGDAPNGSVEQVDRQIERIDPTDAEAVQSLFPKRSTSGDLSTPLAERKAFVHAVRAAERGDASATLESQKTPWGIAAAATSYALQSKFEQALSAAARLERQYPDALASHWTLGFVAEARGRFAAAVRHYQAGEERFPHFAPMITGQLRMHTRQGRAKASHDLQERLRRLSADNPYAVMPLVIPGLDDLAAPGPDSASNDPEKASERAPSSGERPRFVRAVHQLRFSLDAIHRGERSQALEHVDKALELEPHLGPALLVAGVLRVAAMDLDGGLGAFTRLIQLSGLDIDYRWTLQIAAPRALIAIGRADLAYQFVPPVKAAGNVAPRDLAASGRTLPEPVVPLLSVETRIQTEPLAQQALLARAQVLSLLGHTSAASESLGLLDGTDALTSEVGLYRVLTAITRGSRRSATGAVHTRGEHPRALTASAALAFYTGRYADAIEHAKKARLGREGPDDIINLRYLTLALTADGRGREAMVVLEEARVPVFDQPQIDALRMRVLARLAPRDTSSTATYQTFEKMSVTSIDRLIDLADVAFWHKNFDQAREWTDKVLAIAPKHPEANWLRGLLAQVADKERKAEGHFRDAWRDGTDDPRLLIELGRIYLGLGDARRAQAVFYRALLKERTSVEAIRGLGQAYLAYNPKVGHRDLSRILRSYAGSTSYVAQATETLKWLAILSGSRSGDAQGLKFLEQASTMVGDSADLLIERARFHQARGEVSDARKLYARALEKNATLADARAGLARMALEQGDEEVARTQLERYLTLAPEGEHADWARKQLDRVSKAAPRRQDSVEKPAQE